MIVEYFPSGIQPDMCAETDIIRKVSKPSSRWASTRGKCDENYFISQLKTIRGQVAGGCRWKLYELRSFKRIGEQEGG